MMQTVCNVGYALNAKKLRKGGAEKSTGVKKGVEKWCGGGLADILKVDSCSQGVSFRPFNSETMGTDFHVIIHKLTDWDAEESSSKLSAIEAYMLDHPATVIIDPLSSIKKITSRSRACECLQRVLDNEPISCSFDRPFVLPAYCVINKKEEFRQQMESKNLKFPIICKPVHACGTPESHLMVVLVSVADIDLIPSFPCIVQQYHNHDGNFYKVYVIGGDVMVHQRPSLPDLEGMMVGGDEVEMLTLNYSKSVGDAARPASRSDGRTIFGVRSVVFDSRHKYPSWEDFHFPIGICGSDSDLGTAPPTTELDLFTHKTTAKVLEQEVNSAVVTRCKAAAAIVQQEFNLSLFGFDVIIPSRSSSASTPSTASHSSSDSLVDSPVDAAVCTESEAVVSTLSNGRGSGLDILVIDVNFFPSYKEVGDFPQRLTALLRQKAGLPPWDSTTKTEFGVAEASVPCDMPSQSV